MIGTRSFGSLQGGSAIDVPVAALAGLSMAFLAFAAPADLLADLIGSSGLPSILPAAEPPLGLKARLGIGAVAALIVFALAFVLLRWLDRFGTRAPEPVRVRAQSGTDFDMPAPRLRRRDHHPDAPACAPLFAAHELGEPSLDPWPEPQRSPKPESVPLPSVEAEPQATAEPEPQWTPEPVPQATFDPEPQSTLEPEPQPMPEPVGPWPSAPEPPLAQPARPGPVVELESDPVENAWRLSRPYDPIVREKHPSTQAWPQLEDGDEAEEVFEDEAGFEEEAQPEAEAEAEPGPEPEPEAEAEAEEEPKAGFEAGPEAEDVGLVGNPWQFRGEPDLAPQAEIPDEPLTEAMHEMEEDAPVPETPFRRAEPVPNFEPEPASASAPPTRENSVDALLHRLEVGMARLREAPVPQASDLAPAAPAPAPTKPSMPGPADDRLQSAIENLQRLAARRD